MNELNSFVGERIRNIRKAKGWTQEEFAERSKFQPSYIAGVERGERNITLETLEKLLGSLEVNPIVFFYTPEYRQDVTHNIIEKHIAFLLNRNEKEIELIHRLSKDIFKTLT
jgi:transcriptional regulator with XRE-family HTH domain